MDLLSTAAAEALSQQAHDWQDVAIAFIAAIPAICAAVIGVRNGKKIDAHDEWERNGKPVKPSAPRKRSSNRAGGADGNTASNPDWYKAPDL